MKVYTRTGDKGTTALIGGQRIAKDDHRVETYGTVDELMAHIGVLITYKESTPYHEILQKIQFALMTSASHIACVSSEAREKLPPITPEEVEMLEKQIDVLNQDLPPIKYFFLPGGHNTAVAQTHVVRTVTRRLERYVVGLHDENLPPEILQFINRLSDYFYSLGRRMAFELNDPQLEWIV